LDSTVIGWGFNSFGQANVPGGLGGVIDVAAGSFHNVALKSDGTVVAWGGNAYFQTNVPAGLSAVVAVAAGNYHSLALKADGTVVAWGRNNFAQTNVPTGLGGVVAVAAGEFHSLALKSDGTVVAWGNGGWGLRPVPTGLSGIVAIAAGDSHTLVLKSGALAAAMLPRLDADNIFQGTVFAQKFNGNGSGLSALNASALSSGNVPVARIPDLDAAKITSGVLSPDRIPTLDASKISGGTFTGNGAGLSRIPLSALVQSDYSAAAWGRNSDGQATVPDGLNSVVALAAGGFHSLALKADGTVVAWGSNGSGQRTVPLGLSDVMAIAAGYSHNLALKADGTVVAWGSNGSGQRTVPAGLSGVVGIAAGGLHSLALKADDTLVAWGDNSYGQTNVQAGLGGVVALAAGDRHSLALKADGTVVAWGGNNAGQATVPAGLSGVVAIAGGDLHGLALKADGTVVAWGFDAFAQVTVPTELAGVVAITAGGYHNLALKAGIASPATLARLDQGNVFRGTVSAQGFSGDGSGLTSLNASALSSGTVPVARVPDLDAAKITTGTLADARLSANVARLDGSPVFSSDVRLGDHDLYLRGGTDSNHGLGWFGGGGRTFAGATVDGPVLYGFLGGALGSTKTAQRIALSWNDGADVTLGGDLTITNTLSVSSPAGTRAASFTAARTGGHSSSVVQVENTSTSGTASPALRVMGRGASVDGALSVLADSGTIARFRNATDWVAAMDNAGNFAATSFVTLSDRAKKAGFAPVDVEAVLAKVAGLPLTTWHYTNDAAATPHLGPMAQDFHAAFGLGGDDKTITTVDADGVALAAIQGLHHRTTALAAENAVIREELARQQTANADLRDELGELRSLVRQLQQQLNANRP
jgi:alpha-tubulin suppressor-like RCC1 family protein